jgi:hypothetical protein
LRAAARAWVDSDQRFVASAVGAQNTGGGVFPAPVVTIESAQRSI